MKRILILFFAFQALSSFAQTPDWQEDMQEWTTMEDMGDNTNMELLEDLSINKINLNQATREQLEQLPFLSAQQVEGIMEYLYRYGPMRSLSELQMITQLDYQTRQQLKHYVEVGKEQSPPRFHSTNAKATLTAIWVIRRVTTYATSSTTTTVSSSD